jgi:hypothetical protein
MWIISLGIMIAMVILLGIGIGIFSVIYISQKTTNIMTGKTFVIL